MTEGDAAACHRIHAAATMSSYGRVLPWLQPIVEDPATPLEACAWTLVADHGGAVVGYAAVTGNHVENLFVSPDAQGLGVGGRLLAAVEGRIAGAVTLRCLLVNPGARRFYERHGFEVVRVERITYHARELEAWFMRKERR